MRAACNRRCALRALLETEGYVVDVAAMTFAFAIVVVSGAWAIEYGFAPRGSLGLMTLYAASLPDPTVRIELEDDRARLATPARS